MKTIKIKDAIIIGSIGLLWTPLFAQNTKDGIQQNTEEKIKILSDDLDKRFSDNVTLYTESVW